MTGFRRCGDECFFFFGYYLFLFQQFIYYFFLKRNETKAQRTDKKDKTHTHTHKPREKYFKLYFEMFLHRNEEIKHNT